MLRRSYEDFNELYENLVKEILLNPQDRILYRTGNSLYVDSLYLNVKKPTIKEDYSFLVYKENKMKALLCNYVDFEKWKEFKSKLENSKSLSLVYYFNQTKVIGGHNSEKAPCILTFMVSRKNRKEKFSEVFICYRTTELSRVFYIDLILFAQMIKSLSEITNISSINIFIPLPFVYIPHVLIFLKNYPLELDEEDKYIKGIREIEKRFMRKELINFKSQEKIRKFLKNEKIIPTINIRDLFSIEEEKRNDNRLQMF